MNSENPEICNPAIVVIGFNRPNSIQRLLDSIARARFPSDANVTLVISIDFSDSDNGRETKLVAENFDWKHGPKKLVFHDSNLGLRKHVLTCGDLTAKYGSIIMLEDDLTVGPEFYYYAANALDFSETEDDVAGVSLYVYQHSYYLSKLPFMALDDGWDNFYLQVGASWGQAWTARQWSGFRTWYQELTPMHLAEVPKQSGLASAVENWPNSSWLKYFSWYLVLNSKYIMYPRTAHSTNYSETGSNVAKPSPAWQCPLGFSSSQPRFSNVAESLSVYDNFFEPTPTNLKLLFPTLANYDFDVDLSGEKDDHILCEPLVLTSRMSSEDSLFNFSLATKPIETNLSVESKKSQAYFWLVPSSSRRKEKTLVLRDRHVLEYFYGPVAIKHLFVSLGSVLMGVVAAKLKVSWLSLSGLFR